MFWFSVAAKINISSIYLEKKLPRMLTEKLQTASKIKLAASWWTQLKSRYFHLFRAGGDQTGAKSTNIVIHQVDLNTPENQLQASYYADIQVHAFICGF